MVNSSKIMVIDSDSIQVIRELEQRACEEYPAHTLRSCIGERTVNPEDENEAGYIVRVKTTKDPSKYTSESPWTTGAAVTIAQLEYGSAILLKCGHQVWTHQDTVGITIYGNNIHGVGNVMPAWGRQITKPSQVVEWN